MTIEFMDGEVREFKSVGWCTRPASVADGCLTVSTKSGDMEPVRHEGSFPLVNIRTWRTTERS